MPGRSRACSTNAAASSQSCVRHHKVSKQLECRDSTVSVDFGRIHSMEEETTGNKLRLQTNAARKGEEEENEEETKRS